MKFYCRTMLAVCAVMLLPHSAGAQRPIGWFPVPEDHWAYSAVIELMQKKVLEGYPDGYFRGKRGLTRNEFAVAMQRAFLDCTMGKTNREEPQPQNKTLEMAQELKNLAQRGIDLFAYLPANHPAFALLQEMNQQGWTSPVHAPLARYEVMMRLREFRELIQNKSKRETVPAELRERVQKLEGEFQADLDAFDALVKAKQFDSKTLPLSVTELNAALYAEKTQKRLR